MAQPRIYWTRSRTKAAQASVSGSVGLPYFPAPTLREPTPLQHVPPPSTLRIMPLHNSTDETFPAGPPDPFAQVKLEIGEEVKIVSENWIHSLYSALINPADIDTYLSSDASGYRKADGFWVELLHTPASKESLSALVSRIASRVITELGEPCGEGVTREVIDSHSATSKGTGLRPDISFKATGPSFQRGKLPNGYAGGVSYSNLASIIEVELDSKANDTELVAQTALYCKYISMMQPNRNFTRTLIVTERSFRLVHHDRSGFYVSPPMNIHRHAHTFIRIVLGLSSTKEAILGFDTSVQWKCDHETGRKSAGTITTVDANRQPVVYELKMDRPPFVRAGLCGRGTTCWYAIHPQTGEEVLIKDTWRESSKTSEYPYLVAAQGVEGVVQVLSFQDYCAETNAYRPADFVTKNYVCRTKSRVVMRCYGKTLEHFTSRFQAISALRDAIQGHRGLLSKSILHRDVSLQNILMGVMGAAPGTRGILIDLDMAIWTHADLSVLRAERGIGTPRFQSVSVMRNLALQLPPVHDHLDDIESFFYVLCHLVLLFDSPGKRRKEMDERLGRWEEENIEAAADLKISLLINSWECSTWWGEATEELFCGFQEIIEPIVRQRSGIRGSARSNAVERRDRLEAVAKGPVGDIYDKVLKLFDNALAAYEREDQASAAEEPSLEPSTPLVETEPATYPSSKGTPGLANHKRRSEEDHPDASPSKRTRTSLDPNVDFEVRKDVNDRPKAALPKAVRRSARSTPAVLSPALAPPSGPSGISKSTAVPLLKRTSRSKARSVPKKPAQPGTRLNTSPPKPVRRSARLNRP